ncbi:MAG TPA: hypothetical protein VGR96_09170 [Acidobacteriaceae bacterium]|nr:hypothetical protein [Acidobacteriaceae bacterium]
MKKPVTCLVLSGALTAGVVFCGARAFSQTREPGSSPETLAPPPNPGPGALQGAMNADQQLARMTQRYNLSADQQSQIKPILILRQKRIEALRSDSSLSGEDRMARMLSLRRDFDRRMEAILSDEQKKQFEQDQQRMQERMRQRDPGGSAPPQ